MDSKDILIIHGINRQGLAVAKALKTAGQFTIHFISNSTSMKGAIQRALNHDLIDSFHLIKTSYSDAVFLEKLIQIVKRKAIDAILPTATAIIPVSKAKPHLEKFCRVLIEDYENMIRFHDKSKTLEMADILDIPTPFTVFPQTLKDVESFSATAPYPVVLKARTGTAANGVWYAGNASELIYLYKNATDPEKSGDGVVLDSSQPMIQEYIPGEVHDVPVFCVNGEMKLGLTQKRILMKPLSGGIGVINVTTKNKKLLDYARKIAQHTRWSGVMQVEFKMDQRDGQPKLLEVNPRFWGTTWLTICAGYNYPYYLVSQALGEAIEFPKGYKVGLYGRWPAREVETIFEKPFTGLEVLKRIRAFILRFNLKNCVYYLGKPLSYNGQ